MNAAAIVTNIVSVVENGAASGPDLDWSDNMSTMLFERAKRFIGDRAAKFVGAQTGDTHGGVIVESRGQMLMVTVRLRDGSTKVRVHS